VSADAADPDRLCYQWGAEALRKQPPAWPDPTYRTRLMNHPPRRHARRALRLLPLQAQHRSTPHQLALAGAGAIAGFTLAFTLLVASSAGSPQPEVMPAQHRLSTAPSPARLAGATVAPMQP
jgi:hypothetical protein